MCDYEREVFDVLGQEFKYSPRELNLISEFLKTFEKIEENYIFELKHATWNKDIKDKTKDAKYWKGFRYGIQAFWGDWVLPEKEKWEKKKEMKIEITERIK